MIKTLIALLLLSTPTYAATATGSIGATIRTPVKLLSNEDALEFCAQEPEANNCDTLFHDYQLEDGEIIIEVNQSVLTVHVE